MYGIIQIREMGWSKDPGPPAAGMFPAIFFERGAQMNDLSIFVDESGDFGSYEPHAPFYLFTLVFHDQSNSIEEPISHLECSLRDIGLDSGHCFHAGPIIRREEDYQNLSITERRRCLNRILTFAKNCEISYVTFSVEKKHIADALALTVALTKQLSTFIREEYAFFTQFDKIIVYYDNGQVELNKLLASVFAVMLPQAEFRKVIPADYRLFQVADLFCTMELVKLKVEQHILSKSEEAFFGSMRDMKKNYLKPIAAKQYHKR